MLKTRVTSSGKIVRINKQNGQNLVTVEFPRGCVIGERPVSLEFLGVQDEMFDLAADSITYPQDKKTDKVELQGKMLTDILRLTQPMDCVFLIPVAVRFPLSTKQRELFEEYKRDDKSLQRRTIELSEKSIEIRTTVFSDIGLFLNENESVSLPQQLVAISFSYFLIKIFVPIFVTKVTEYLCSG